MFSPHNISFAETLRAEIIVTQKFEVHLCIILIDCYNAIHLTDDNDSCSNAHRILVLPD